MNGSVPAELAPALTSALAHAAAGDSVGVMHALDPIFDLGDDALFAAFCGTCGVIQTLNPYFAPDPDSYLGFDIVGPFGNVIEPQDAGPEAQGAVFAMRFLLAWCNGETAAERVRDASALFWSTDPAVLAAGFSKLIAIAACEIRGQVKT